MEPEDVEARPMAVVKEPTKEKEEKDVTNHAKFVQGGIG